MLSLDCASVWMKRKRRKALKRETSITVAPNCYFFSLFHMDVSATAEDDVSMLTLNERPASREC